MTTLTEVRKALADTIKRGIGSVNVNVKWYELSADSAIATDRISVAVASIENTLTQGIAADAVLRVVVEVGGQDDETLALRIDSYLDRVGDLSLFSIIEDDPTLGGLVADLNPVRAEVLGPARADIEVAVMFL